MRNFVKLKVSIKQNKINLAKKINESNKEKQKLIALVLEAPEALQYSLKEGLSQAKQNKEVRDLLQALLNVVIDFNNPLSADLEKKDSFDKVVEALTAKEALEKFAPSDPLAAARLKGVQIKRDLLYLEGQPLTSQQVASLLDITRQAVDKRRNKGQLLAVSLGKRGYLYPIWQFNEDKILSGLDRVLAEIKDLDPWTQLMFLKTGDIRLEGATPLEVLKMGEIHKVVLAASCYGKHISA